MNVLHHYWHPLIWSKEVSIDQSVDNQLSQIETRELPMNKIFFVPNEKRKAGSIVGRVVRNFETVP